MYFCNLGSGSKGNSSFVKSGDSAILVDQGFSGKESVKRLSSRDIDPKSIKAIIITHEHSDHIKGTGIFARRFDIPIYITRKTYNNIKDDFFKKVKIFYFNSGDYINIEDLKIKSFHIPHDAVDPVGMTISDGSNKIAMATDIGDIRNAVTHFLSELDLLYLESNHDKEMLINGPYPLYLKQRIKSRVGHLSNRQAVELLNIIKQNNKLDHLVLGHLSEKNNKAYTVQKLFEENAEKHSESYNIEVASQDSPGELIKI